MSTNTLLVLAATTYQIPVIQCAKRLGYRVMTADNRPENPGHRLADISFEVDTTDIEGILRLARENSIDGVIAAASDVAVPTAAHVANHLNLPGLPVRAARLLCDKVAIREFLGRHGFRVAKGYTYLAGQTPDPVLFDGQPWVMKPHKSSGGKGVFVLSSLEEYCERLPESLKFAPEGTVILEKFIEGSQQTFEGFVIDGDIRLRFFLDRDTAPVPYTTTYGHRVPTHLPRIVQARFLSQLSEILALLEIRDGPVDCDFVVDGEEVVFLELSPRMGGNSIAGLLRIAGGVDIVEWSVKLACGEPFETPCSPEIIPAAVILLGAEESGLLSYDADEMNLLREEKWVSRMSMDFKPGARVTQFRNSRFRIGEAIVIGESRQEIDKRVSELRSRIAISILDHQ